MIDENITPQPVLKVQGDDPRAMMYQTIARVHRDIIEAKWKARTAKTGFNLRPEILIHLEESVAFLAEELLKLQTVVEKAAKDYRIGIDKDGKAYRVAATAFDSATGPGSEEAQKRGNLPVDEFERGSVADSVEEKG